MPYVFLKNNDYTPRSPMLAIGRNQALKAVKWVAEQPHMQSIVHFDLETVGLNAEDSNRVITNVGIATKDWLVGIDLTQLTTEEARPVWDWLKQHKLGGFNLKFDMSWPWGSDVSPEMYGVDTAIWFRWLATESLKAQPHSLDAAIKDVLGWPEECYQKTWLKDKLNEHNLKKDEMYKLALYEPRGYTSYCALDAEASFQLEEAFANATRDKGFMEVWEDLNIRILPHKTWRNIQAQYQGIEIDRQACKQWMEKLSFLLGRTRAEVLEHDMVAPHIEDWLAEKMAKEYVLSIREKRVWAKKEDEPWLYPNVWMFTPSKNKNLPKWLKDRGGRYYQSEPLFVVKGKNKPFPKFNFSSTDDMRWLIYDKWLAGNWELAYFMDGTPSHVNVTIDSKTYEVELTQNKSLPTGGDILKLFGEVGNKINQYKMLDKLLNEFLLKYYRASERSGRIHPTLKINGAATGRASGGG